MSGQPDALIVTAAVWVAAAVATRAACSLLRARRTGRALTAVVLTTAACAGGVANAQPPHPRPAATPSLAWGAAEPVDSGVVVRPGDCLWAITARQLGEPTAAQVAAHWPDWWRANRRVIGADPNVIHPGQRLRRPTPMPRRH